MTHRRALDHLHALITAGQGGDPGEWLARLADHLRELI
jgi:hypothetical protein